MPTLWKRNTQITMFGKDSKTPDLTKLKIGYTFRLDRVTWKITEVAQYDWTMDNTSIEYTIITGTQKAYLEVEFTKGKYEITYSEAVIISDAFLIDAITSKQIIHNNTLFEFDQKYSGDYKNLTTHSTRENLECFLFYAENEDVLTIEKWADGSYEAFLGEDIKAKKIKKIKEN